jgi:hypothetical protein
LADQLGANNWYQHKAEQCLILASATTDAKLCTKFKEEVVLWCEIGADVLRQNREKQSSGKTN